MIRWILIVFEFLIAGVDGRCGDDLQFGLRGGFACILFGFGDGVGVLVIVDFVEIVCFLHHLGVVILFICYGF